MKRGALIVVEGVDRTGKSTQCKALVENLQNKTIKSEYRNFPARQTEIGKVIDRYLTSKSDLNAEAIHLLFSANRWERAKSIVETLNSGTSVIVDRYCYSGVAFSAAKGLDLNWCKTPDIGLPCPDKVFFLTMPLDVVKERKGYGKERYEVLEFQNKVLNIYNQLKEDNWTVIDANRSIEEIQKEMLKITLEIVDCVNGKPIQKLWQEDKDKLLCT